MLLAGTTTGAEPPGAACLTCITLACKTPLTTIAFTPPPTHTHPARERTCAAVLNPAASRHPAARQPFLAYCWLQYNVGPTH